jgi:hypothetical protein
MLLSGHAEPLEARISLHCICALACRAFTWHKSSAFYLGLEFYFFRANSVQNIWVVILGSEVSNIQ